MGGSPIPSTRPGRLMPSAATLGRGATQDRDLVDTLQDAAASSGLDPPDAGYERSLDVVQQDRDGLTPRRWSLSRA